MGVDRDAYWYRPTGIDWHRPIGQVKSPVSMTWITSTQRSRQSGRRSGAPWPANIAADWSMPIRLIRTLRAGLTARVVSRFPLRQWRTISQPIPKPALNLEIRSGPTARSLGRTSLRGYRERSGGRLVPWSTGLPTPCINSWPLVPERISPLLRWSLRHRKALPGRRTATVGAGRAGVTAPAGISCCWLLPKPKPKPKLKPGS